MLQVTVVLGAVVLGAVVLGAVGLVAAALWQLTPFQEQPAPGHAACVSTVQVEAFPLVFVPLHMSCALFHAQPA